MTARNSEHYYDPTPADAIKHLTPKKRKKYNATKIEVDGITFDSKKEAKRYQELRMLERAGKITDLKMQVKYELLPNQYRMFERYSDKTGNRLKDGKELLERALNYIADFTYEQDGKLIVEDVKGYRDPASAGYAKFVIKRKLMLYMHNIKIKEV